MSGNDVAPSATNDLTKSIWDSQQAKNASAGTSDNPPAEALGIDITTNGAVDDVFYRENVSYQLPLVRAGWSLGQFDPAGFGFEIMVEAIGFDPALPLVRTAANIITVAALSPSPTQAEEFEHWHDKEAILNYIDPCAFFGGFYFHTLKVKHANGSVSKKKKNEVYDDVLKGPHLTAANEGMFFNRNRTYLDIRNEYNHSINYFKNYGTYTNTDINCAFAAADPLTARNYYASHWPLMVLDNSDFPTGNAASNKNFIRLALPDGAGDNPLPTLYISAGYLADLYPREPKDKGKLIDVNVAGGFTDEVALAFPNRDDLSTTTAVSTYTKLKYFKRFDPSATTPPVSSGTVIRASNYLDSLFIPFAMKIPFGGSARIKSVLCDTETFVSGGPTSSGDSVVKVGKAEDVSNVTLFACPFIVRDESVESISVPYLLSGQSVDGDDTFLNVFARSYAPERLRKSQLIISASATMYVEFVNDNGVNSTKAIPDLDRFIGFAFGHATFNILTNLASSHFETKYGTHLGVTNIQAQTDDLGFNYVSYELVLRGFVLNGGVIGVGEIRTDPATNFTSNIVIYSS